MLEVLSLLNTLIMRLSKKMNFSKASTKVFRMMLMEVLEGSLKFPQTENK